jgi:hypothetical protein
MIDMPLHFILEGKIAKPTDFLTWAMWYETADRTVARTEIDNVVVSTVFFGLDFSFGSEEVPELFETMGRGAGRFQSALRDLGAGRRAARKICRDGQGRNGRSHARRRNHRLKQKSVSESG